MYTPTLFVKPRQAQRARCCDAPYYLRHHNAPHCTVYEPLHIGLSSFVTNTGHIKNRNKTHKHTHTDQTHGKGKGKGKGQYSSSWEPHLRATGRHLPYEITLLPATHVFELPPDASERAPPNPSRVGWYLIYLPRRNGRLS